MGVCVCVRTRGRGLLLCLTWCVGTYRPWTRWRWWWERDGEGKERREKSVVEGGGRLEERGGRRRPPNLRSPSTPQYARLLSLSLRAPSTGANPRISTRAVACTGCVVGVGGARPEAMADASSRAHGRGATHGGSPPDSLSPLPLWRARTDDGPPSVRHPPTWRPPQSHGLPIGGAESGC